MKTMIYMGNYNLVSKSGIGRAILHQKKSLEKASVDVTTSFEKDIDVVHINTVFPASVIMAMRAKLSGKKVIYYGHSTAEDFRNSFKGSNLVAPLFKRWIKFCYSQGDVIITPTKYSKKLLEGYGLKKPVRSLSNGIDTEFFSKTEEARMNFRKKYGFSDDEKVVISVGHYIQRKGILDFIELAKSMPKVKFIWFGHTNLNIVPSKIAEGVKNPPDNLIFPGFISRKELRDAYCGADAFVFMSHEETEGIVVLEALACSIPTIVRDIPVYNRWLHNGKNVYKSSSQEDFQDKLQGLLSGKLPSLCEEGLLVAKKRSMTAIGEQLKEITGLL